MRFDNYIKTHLYGSCQASIIDRFWVICPNAVKAYLHTTIYHDIFPVICQCICGSDDWRKNMPSSSRKFTPPQPPTTPPKLIVPRSEARQKLEAHIEKGHEIANRSINS